MTHPPVTVEAVRAWLERHGVDPKRVVRGPIQIAIVPGQPACMTFEALVLDGEGKPIGLDHFVTEQRVVPLIDFPETT